MVEDGVEYTTEEVLDGQTEQMKGEERPERNEADSTRASDVPSHVLEGPVVGTMFPDRSSCYEAYKQHAWALGFSIVTRSSRKLKGGGLSVLFTCDRGGRPVNVEADCTKRCGCSAKVRVTTLDLLTWRVTMFVSQHNHELDPDHSRFLSGHRSLSSIQKRTLEVNDICAIRTCASIRQMEVVAEGPCNLGCSATDCRNFVDTNMKLRLTEGDAESLNSMFLAMLLQDANFFHLIDSDSEGRLRNVFWVDHRARVAYSEFNDVVTFDTTYLVNKYNMPFASFIGVNHHGQSILFGCALISDESAHTFQWVFSTWLKAMGNRKPRAILTDQDEAIKVAIKAEMPETTHRLCIWHILNKIPVKFAGVEDLKQVSNDFMETVYENLTTEEFEGRWQAFLNKHDMWGDTWLSKLYEIRSRWVPVYLKHVFFAGMSSTQRSESMHAFYDGYINPVAY